MSKINQAGILRAPKAIGTMPTWKVQIQAAKRQESNRRAKLANLPDLKNQRDSDLAAIQGIFKEFTKDGIQTDSVLIDLAEFGEAEDYPEY